MLNLGEVDRLADKAATAVLKGIQPSKVFSAGTSDSDGQDALLVTIVFRSTDADSITGETALDTIVRIQDDLLASGEERFAVVRFVTEDELMSDDDP